MYSKIAYISTSTYQTLYRTKPVMKLVCISIDSIDVCHNRYIYRSIAYAYERTAINVLHPAINITIIPLKKFVRRLILFCSPTGI